MNQSGSTRWMPWISFVVALTFALSAGAAPTDHLYSDYFGTNYDFTGLKETVQTADDDPNPLFEAPSGVGDQLMFAPSSFDATAAGGTVAVPVQDISHSTFNATITSNGAAFVDLITIEEGGDIILTGFAGGGGTGVFASMSGTLTILASTNAADVGEIITWGGTGADFEAVFTPGGGTSTFLTTPPPGSTAWSAFVAIDIASLYTGVTSVELQYNNFLQAVSNDGGNSALIQKKAARGPKITVIPEAGTMVLMAPGLIALAVRARRGEKARIR